MGLAVIHGIVKAHHGAITVESNPEKGTQFTVYLPLSVEERQAIRTGPGVAHHQLNKGIGKILLVDDDVIILESVRQELKDLGYEVVTGISGLAAMKVFSKMPESFDLVITDVAMPGMTGMELAAKLVEIRPDIPIILCTGFSDVIDSHTMKDLGICGILNKPADVDELKNAIDQALKNEVFSN
jgi:CheY-like chemotaxis protein